MERLLTRQDVAERLQVGINKAGEYMRTMRCVVLPGEKRRRVTEEDFERWLTARKTEAPRVRTAAQPARLARKKNGRLVDWRREA